MQLLSWSKTRCSWLLLPPLARVPGILQAQAGPISLPGTIGSILPLSSVGSSPGCGRHPFSQEEDKTVWLSRALCCQFLGEPLSVMLMGTVIGFPLSLFSSSSPALCSLHVSPCTFLLLKRLHRGRMGMAERSTKEKIKSRDYPLSKETRH